MVLTMLQSPPEPEPPHGRAAPSPLYWPARAPTLLLPCTKPKHMAPIQSIARWAARTCEGVIHSRPPLHPWCSGLMPCHCQHPRHPPPFAMVTRLALCSRRPAAWPACPQPCPPPGSDTGTEFHDFPSDVARRVRTLPRQRHSGSCQIVSSSRSTSEEQRRCAPCDTGSAPPPQPAPETAQAAPPLRFGRELLPPPY